MYKQTILLVFVDRIQGGRLCRSLADAGYEVSGTSSSTQAIALSFVIQSLAAVVLDQRTEEHSIFDLARNLRAVRPHLPVILLSRERIPHLPAYIDACVSGEETVESFLSVLNAILDHSKAA
jgi:DNA-binding NtrC family response regulator